VSPHISGIFCLFPLSMAASRNFLKIRDITEKFKNPQQFFSYFCSFQQTSFFGAKFKVSHTVSLMTDR
jgi:hypothetical protein